MTAHGFAGLERRGQVLLVTVLAAAIVVPLLNLLPAEDSALQIGRASWRERV